MKDLTLPRGLVTRQDISKPQNKGLFSLRKMFWKYLKAFGVAFIDPCCDEADASDREPVAWDESQGQIVRWNGTSWIAITAFSTTTTTTAAPTTTTTTAAPTTTTTTTHASTTTTTT